MQVLIFHIKKGKLEDYALQPVNEIEIGEMSTIDDISMLCTIFF